MKIKARINLVLSGAAMVAMAAIGAVSYIGLRSEAVAVAQREAQLHLQAVDAARAYAAEEVLPSAWAPEGDARLLSHVNRHYVGHDYAEVVVHPGEVLTPPLDQALQRLRDQPHDAVVLVDNAPDATRLTFARGMRSTAPGAGGSGGAPLGLQMVTMPLDLPMRHAQEVFWRQLAGMAALVIVLFLALNLMLRRLVVNPVHVHQRALRRLAIQDSLTGAINRRGFMDGLLRAQGEARQGGRALSLVMLDLDHFKRINDEHGHGAGDIVLREVVQRLRRQIRRGDMLGRLGGEEFAILLPDTDLGGARAQAAHLLEVLRGQPFPAVGKVTASLGVAQWNGQEDTSSWMQRADLALYDAKHLGRDRVVVAEELDTDLLTTLPDRL